MPAKYRVAAQMFGFRDYIKTLEDAAKTMKRVKRIGYDYCQVSGFGPMDMADLRRVCEDAGVTPIGAHISLPQFRENEKKVLEDCRKLGISYVAIPWLKASDQKTLADWKALFREFEGYAKRFAKEGVTVQYHNHAFEFQKFGIKGGKGGKTILDMFYDGTKAIQAELDLGWCARGGYNPVYWIRKVSGRMDQVHLKDWGITEDDLYRDAMAVDGERVPGLYDVMELMKDPFSTEINAENYLNGKTIADCTSPIPFFVLTYKDRVLGASIMANSDVLEKIGDVFGDNYLLAPSSIHELLVVRDDKGAAENLTKACREGNNKDVLPSDVLSDKVLRYDFKHKTLKNAIGDRVRAREEEMESEKREKPKRKGR